MAAVSHRRRAATANPRNAEADAAALLDQIGESYVRFAPEGATSLGIDTGARAALRSQLADRSAEGQQKIASQVRQDLEKVKAFDVSGLSHATRTSIEVVRSAYQLASDGFALPYGDITVGQLAQYAVRGDPERRRISGPSAVSRQRPSDRERR